MNKRKQNRLIAMDRARQRTQRDRRRALALDKKSVRSVSPDGHLHIALTNISKANVCPYQGSEIPDAEELGLDPEAVYYLYRDPQELALAASTFNNLPLLSTHVPVSAEEPQKELIVGSTGTDARMQGVYLVNSMVVWDGAAIAGIEAEVQREISSAYRYRADMTPGIVNGERYDGVMRDIVGNHVALVETGRAGPDVFAADRQPFFNTERSSMKLSRKALTVRGALHAYLRPKLAQDSKIEALNPLVQGITAASFSARKGALVKAVEGKFKSKLAQDANLADLSELIDAFMEKDGNDADGEVNAQDDDDEAMDDGQGDPDPERTNALEFLKGKLSPEDHAKVTSMFSTKAKAAQDDIENDPDDDDKSKKPKPVIKAAQDDEATDPIVAPGTAKVGKKAMDAAIRQAEDAVVVRMNAIRAAEKAVAAHIGEVEPQETAAAVYKLALDAARVDLTGVHPSAYAAMVRMLPLPGSRTALDTRIAQDSGSVSTFLSDFPGAVIPARA